MDNISQNTTEEQLVQNQPAHVNNSVRGSEAEDFRVALYCNRKEVTVLTDEGELVKSGEDSCHLELCVAHIGQRASPVTGLDVKVTLTDSEGNIYGPYRMDFLCNSGGQHYGTNLDLEAGRYDVEAEIKPGLEEDKQVYGPEKAEVKFSDVKID